MQLSMENNNFLSMDKAMRSMDFSRSTNRMHPLYTLPCHPFYKPRRGYCTLLCVAFRTTNFLFLLLTSDKGYKSRVTSYRNMDSYKQLRILESVVKYIHLDEIFHIMRIPDHVSPKRCKICGNGGFAHCYPLCVPRLLYCTLIRGSHPKSHEE